MAEKKLAEIAVRVDLETKSQFVGLADKRGLEGGASELVRASIADLLARERAEYIALHSIFGQSGEE